MRTRLSRRTDGASARRWSIAALAALALFVALRVLAPGLLLAAASPLFAIGDGISGRVGGLFASLGNARTLAGENAQLAAANAALSLENQRLAGKLADLVALVGTTTPPAPRLLASVVARPPEAPYDVLILEGGAAAGITREMEVIGPAGTPLGVVEGVTVQFSRVRLFSAAGVVTDAWVGASRVPILLKGAGGSFAASVPQGAGLAAGDLVYLASSGAAPIARVARVGGSATEPVSTLSIAPLVNPLSLTWVELVETPAAASSTLLAAPRP